MWLLSWIREGKQQKILIEESDTVLDYLIHNKDIGLLIEYIPRYAKSDPKAPKKESTSTRLIPLSDTTYKEDK